MPNQDVKTPNPFVEVFFSVFKWLLLFFTVIILALVGLFGLYIHKSFNGTSSSIQVSQDGYQNTQDFVNGTTNS